MRYINLLLTLTLTLTYKPANCTSVRQKMTTVCIDEIGHSKIILSIIMGDVLVWDEDVIPIV